MLSPSPQMPIKRFALPPPLRYLFCLVFLASLATAQTHQPPTTISHYPSCSWMNPQDVHVNAISATHVRLNWTRGGYAVGDSGAFVVVGYAPSNTSIENPIGPGWQEEPQVKRLAPGQNSVDLDGLAPATNYGYRLRVDCSGRPPPPEGFEWQTAMWSWFQTPAASHPSPIGLEMAMAALLAAFATRWKNG